MWRIHFNAGKAAHADGDAGAAEAEFRRSLAYARHENPPGLRTAVTLNALSVLYLDRGEVAAAEPLLTEALGIFERVAATPNEHFVALLTNVGEVQLKLGRAAEAEAHYQRAALLAGKLDPPNRDLELRARRGVLISLCAQGRREQARLLGRPLGVECRP